MALKAEHETCALCIAGSGLEAARQLRLSNTSRASEWHFRPSVATWRLQQSRLQVRAADKMEIPETGAEPLLRESSRKEPDVQLGVKMHSRVAPWMWCVDENAFDMFVETVRQAHALGMIHNDPDPSTGHKNFFHDDPQVGPNMHVVNKYVIIPRTRSAGGMSWALMDRPNGLSISFFVTHSWKEGVYEFYRKVKHSWPPGMSMWCCFLANPQSWQYSDLKHLLGGKYDLSDSPFMQALSATTIERFLVVPNCNESLYRRLWCVAELKKAMEIEMELGSPFIFVAKDPLPVHSGARKHESIATMISEATCSDKADEARIRDFIHGREQDIEDMIFKIAKGRSESRHPMTAAAGAASAAPARRHSDIGHFGAAGLSISGAASPPAGPPSQSHADFSDVVSSSSGLERAGVDSGVESLEEERGHAFSVRGRSRAEKGAMHMSPLTGFGSWVKHRLPSLSFRGRRHSEKAEERPETESLSRMSASHRIRSSSARTSLSNISAPHGIRRSSARKKLDRTEDSAESLRSASPRSASPTREDSREDLLEGSLDDDDASLAQTQDISIFTHDLFSI